MIDALMFPCPARLVGERVVRVVVVVDDAARAAREAVDLELDVDVRGAPAVDAVVLDVDGEVERVDAGNAFEASHAK
jgi:hypothetical protein